MKNNLSAIILGVIFIIFIIVIWWILNNSKIKPKIEVQSVTPLPDAQNIDLDDDITITLKKEISNEYFSLISIVIKPDIKADLELISPRIVKVSHGQFKPNTLYQGKVIFNKKEIYTWKWTTLEYISTYDNKLFTDIDEYKKKYYPLIAYLPTNQIFTIKYLKKLTLEVNINKATKEEVLSFIRSKGIDPDTHQIIWIE